MGREGIWLDQPPVEPVDVARWRGDEEFAVCPEGARDKSLLYSPSPTPYGFLIPGHRYLFKHSAKFYPDQFWTEIIAYRIGCLLGVPVPPALVAWDSDTDTCGALIEWFLDYPGAPPERYVSGGDIMSDMIHGYDRKRWPDLKGQARDRLASFNIDAMRASITTMTEFPVPVPLTLVRAGLVCRLTEGRHQALVQALT